MDMIARNLRFPADQYRELKLLALSEGKSTAALIREAVFKYKNEKLTSKIRVDLAEKFRKAALRIDVPVVELVKQGRRLE